MEAEKIARAVANSPLVKTAIAGCDPNWGRILCAAGYSGAKFDPAKVDIRINELFLCRKGLDAGFDEGAAKWLKGLRDVLAEFGMRCSGLSPDGSLVEMNELPDHPWYIGCQFHPELKSRPTRPHPLFASFIAAAHDVRRRRSEAPAAESAAVVPA